MPADFHKLQVSGIIQETHDTRSYVFNVPESLREEFRYRSGQFLTFEVPWDGMQLPRCYSLSSAPETDPWPKVTVKRVDGVRDCLVVGIENEKFGQAVTAVVSLEDGASIDSAGIITSVKNDLAGFKAPKSVIFVDQVPRAPNGKADYRAAKEHAEAGL